MVPSAFPVVVGRIVAERYKSTPTNDCGNILKENKRRGNLMFDKRMRVVVKRSAMFSRVLVLGGESVSGSLQTAVGPLAGAPPVGAGRGRGGGATRTVQK